MEKAVFGAGCFWGVEESCRKLGGVIETEVGYMGGSVEEASYREVCGGRTGHAEVCEVRFDPAMISYAQLLNNFWRMHDPAQVDRQGPDVGYQYRSVIFYCSEEQRVEAERSKAELESSGRYAKPVVTAVEAAGQFWPAEEYHQRYFEKKGGGACHLPGR